MHQLEIFSSWLSFHVRTFYSILVPLRNSTGKINTGFLCRAKILLFVRKTTKFRPLINIPTKVVIVILEFITTCGVIMTICDHDLTMTTIIDYWCNATMTTFDITMAITRATPKSFGSFLDRGRPPIELRHVHSCLDFLL